MKKTVVLLLCFLVSVSVFAGGKQEKAEEMNEPVTLVVWDFKYGEPEGAGPAFKKMDQMFMERYPDVLIEHVAQPHDQYHQVISAAIAAQEGPDVIMLAGEAASFEYSDFLVTLDDYIAPIRNQISEDIWSFCAQDKDLSNGIKIAPLTTQGFGFYYNKDLFRQAGLDPSIAPTEWPDFLDACKSLKEAGITPIIWGNTPAYYTNWLEGMLISTFYGTEGNKGFATGKSNFTDPEFRTVLEMLHELREKDYLDPVGADIPLFMEAIEKFKNGEGALFFGLISDIAHWKDFNDALGKDNVGFFPTINHPSAKYKNAMVVGGLGLGWSVTTWSEHKDVAVDYITHYITGDAPLEFVKQTGAIVPSSQIDYSSLGYGLVTEILDYMSKNTADDPVLFIPTATQTDMMAYDELLFNAEEISVDKYIKAVQKSLEENR